ncbi:hypothetical protein DSO57_1021705 [Entomophthora muscae]|uniref:Uncharacterized protein n=1 Tax=Entomophthora muscae TaxID=34485 RepID=A0ACC2TEP1_9FUNG|nr:hypothetical protein DSO57_1021705 [Entomophthora muscae]
MAKRVRVRSDPNLSAPGPTSAAAASMAGIILRAAKPQSGRGWTYLNQILDTLYMPAKKTQQRTQPLQVSCIRLQREESRMQYPNYNQINKIHHQGNNKTAG